MVLQNQNTEKPNGHSRPLNLVSVGGDPSTWEQITQSVHHRWPRASITPAESGARVLELVTEAPPDLVLIHTNLRGMFPQVLVEELRSFSRVPIIVLTSDPDETEAVTALELGADDYLEFPCAVWHFIARVWAVLRRSGRLAPLEEPGRFLVCGRLAIDPVASQAFLDSRRVHLTPAEFRLLYLLARNQGEVVSHQSLVEEIQEEAHKIDQRPSMWSAQKYIQRLRWKLEDNAGAPVWIANVYGTGYRFVGPRPYWRGPFPGN
jgi:DNA-binding response OmpR family regulator